MREQIKDKGCLEHILKSIERIEHFVEGVDFNDFKKDELRYFAIVKECRNHRRGFIHVVLAF